MFPFGRFCQVRLDEILIVSVMDLRRDPKNRPTASQARRALRDLTPKLSGVSFPLGAPSSSPGSTGAVPAVAASPIARAESA